MLLSEMFGEKLGKPFKVEGYEDEEFSVQTACGGVEVLYERLKNRCWSKVGNGVLCHIISLAPSGIIHLPPPLTDEQREQLKALHRLGGRFLAKDGSGEVFAHDSRPTKVKWTDRWIIQRDGEQHFNVFQENPVCGLVSWSDPEPYDIAKALGVEG